MNELIPDDTRPIIPVSRRVFHPARIARLKFALLGEALMPPHLRGTAYRTRAGRPFVTAVPEEDWSGDFADETGVRAPILVERFLAEHVGDLLLFLAEHGQLTWDWACVGKNPNFEKPPVVKEWLKGLPLRTNGKPDFLFQEHPNPAMSVYDACLSYGATLNDEHVSQHIETTNHVWMLKSSDDKLPKSNRQNPRKDYSDAGVEVVCIGHYFPPSLRKAWDKSAKARFESWKL